MSAGPATLRLPRELILASAGSGKTFRISSRIIGLLAHGEPPDAILASTFTRKAAGEILGRVLVRLAEAALDPAQARELAVHAALHDDAAPLDRDRCLALLADLARALHRLSIGTLDSLFIRKARTFAHELGLPPGWAIADEPTARRVRAEALQEVLRQADPGAVVELVRLANRGAVGRSVQDGLLRRLEALHEIHHQVDPAADAWTIFPGLGGSGGAAAATGPADRGAIGRVAGEPPGESTGAAHRAAAPAISPADRNRLAEAIEGIAPPVTSKGTPIAHWVRAIAAAADAIRRGDWESFVGQTLTQKVIAGEEAYARGVIEDDVRALFEEALEVACTVIGRRLAAQAGAMGRLVALFADALARLQQREGAYRFDDVTRLLGGPKPPGARPDLHYRLDARLRHLLLDEFQDTSVPQWSALEPLVDAFLAGADPARAAVIVADPKQSIYGWRGARPELVRGVGDRYALERDVLARSWRSSQVVLDVVNDVFGGIAANGALDDADREVAAEWARSFTRHEAARELPGHVRLVVGPDDGGRANHRPKLLARAAALVRDLHAEAPGRDIGVLTRENKGVARLMFELRRLGVDASEEGGNPLTDSPAVASVLALVRLADHPDDRLARYHVARTPVGAAVDFDDPGDDHAARRVAFRFRERLLRDGYGETLNALATALRPACDARDARRLAQLVELAFRYDARATLRPTDFVRVVESERVEDPTAASVRVMTIHQSKGLEFDIVVLPELDTGVFRGGGEEALPFRAEPTGPITRVYPYVDGKVRALFPEIEEAYRQQRAAVLRDALSTLYVAMTRAKHALHIVVRPDGRNGPSKATSPAMIVRHALAPDTPAAEGDVLYETGDAAWHAQAGGGTEATVTAAAPEPGPAATVAPAAAEVEVPAAAVSSRPLLRDAGPRRRRMLPRRAPSDLEGGDRVDLRDRLRLDARASLEYGTLIHAWCQEIAWIDDGLPDDERLIGIARGVAPRIVGAGADAGVDPALLTRFRQQLTRPEIRAALGRGAYPAGARLERELRFIHRREDAVVEGVIDRLVLWSDGRGGAEILDYKTDDVAVEELERRAAYYRPQLEAYRAAVVALFRLEPERVGAKLLFLRPGVVVDV